MARFGRIINNHTAGRLDRIVLPGFQGAPMSAVIRFIVKGFTKGVLVTRASSIAFNFLLALLPTLIFMFTLIPFVPIPNFQEEMIRLFEFLMPESAFSFLEITIIDVVTRRSGSLLAVMFLATLIFSTNGIHALINAFVVSAHDFRSRSWIEQRKISIVLLIIIVTMILLAVNVLIAGKMLTARLVEKNIIRSDLVIYIFRVLKSIVNICLLFFAISFLYWLAPAGRSEFRFLSPGSVTATLLFIITSLGFTAYVNNFGQYNQLYGSVGTLMILLVWLYLNSISLLIGFELNVSINAANAELAQETANDCSDDKSSGLAEQSGSQDLPAEPADGPTVF